MNGHKYLQAPLSSTGNTSHDMKADYNPAVAMMDSQDHEEFREQLTHKSPMIISNLFTSLWPNLEKSERDPFRFLFELQKCKRDIDNKDYNSHLMCDVESSHSWSELLSVLVCSCQKSVITLTVGSQSDEDLSGSFGQTADP